jgi:hypothetical protein
MSMKSWNVRWRRGPIVSLAAVLCAATACGYSEDALQAKVLENEMLQKDLRACAQARDGANGSTAPSDQTLPGCGKDTDCKGDRICKDGRCTSPL